MTKLFSKGQQFWKTDVGQILSVREDALLDLIENVLLHSC